MPRWIKNGGWIAILTALIFLTFCVFGYTYSKTRTKTVMQQRRFDALVEYGADLLTFTAHASDDSNEPETQVPDSVPSNGDTPDEPDHADGSSDEPPVIEDIEEHNPPDEMLDNEHENAAVPETENLFEEDENEDTEKESWLFDDDEYGGNFIQEDNMQILSEIRDILKIILGVQLLLISSAVAYLVFRFVYKTFVY